MVRVCYFVHDLGDDAVHRRVRMLQDGGAAVTLAGFVRQRAPLAVAGLRPIEFGRTTDGRLARRIGAILTAWFRLAALRKASQGTEVIIARQLETLVLAALARRLFAPASALVYECLDIHRMMLGRSVASRALRWLERRLLARCALLIVSSPAFITNHFGRYPGAPPTRLVENKVLASDVMAVCRRPVHAPWRIGWFGIIRCAISLAILSALVRAQNGRVEVIIRGRPSYRAIPDFDGIAAATPGLRFCGAYDGRGDLARIYGEVHFTWAVDFSQEGGNSRWLLPNRLYEGASHGSVMLARRAVQTGSWLRARGTGVLLDDPVAASLHAYFAALTPAIYSAAAQPIQRQDVVCDTAECQALVADLANLRPTGSG